MKILFITDSLAFPREFPELVLYNETYISILKNEFPEIDFIHLGIGGGTIKSLFQYSEYYHKTLKPDIVFIQSGIVDCAPRTLTFIESEFIKRVPILNKYLFLLIKKNSFFLRKYRKITYTSLDVFENFVIKFQQTFQNVFWIKILPVTNGYEKKIFGIDVNIKKYNCILNKYKNVDVSDFTDEDVQSDFHHLSVLGHKKISLKLSLLIKKHITSL